MALPYRVVDVFARRRYGGNPLTVLLDASDLQTETMQAIATETNHSETAFIVSPVDGGAWHVRYFTPKAEIPFAGHPTLGTAAVLEREVGADTPVTLELPVGRVPVRREGDTYWMDQPPASFGPKTPPDRMARVLDLEPDDIGGRGPVQSVSTGLPFHIVPVRSLEAARKAHLDLDALRALHPDEANPMVLVVADETVDPDADLHVRCFTEALGPREDPATGSANGCLAAWLVRHGDASDGIEDVVVEQGLEMGRPSRLQLRAKDMDGTVSASVGGNVVDVAHGEFLT